MLQRSSACCTRRWSHKARDYRGRYFLLWGPLNTKYLVFCNLTCWANLTGCSLVADSEGISFIAGVAVTGGEMVCHGARGPGTTDARTGIFTFVPHTGQVAGTLLVDGTLWLALSVGISLQAWQAGTGGCLVPLTADGIEATGTRPAGINDLWLGGSG